MGSYVIKKIFPFRIYRQRHILPIFRRSRKTRVIIIIINIHNKYPKIVKKIMIVRKSRSYIFFFLEIDIKYITYKNINFQNILIHINPYSSIFGGRLYPIFSIGNFNLCEVQPNIGRSTLLGGKSHAFFNLMKHLFVFIEQILLNLVWSLNF